MATSGLLRRQAASVLPVGGGLLVLGASAYVVLGLAGHTLPPAEYATFASLYLLTAVVGPGVFVALEQETNREMSARIAAGVGTGPVSAAATRVGSGLTLLVTALLLALSPLLVPQTLGDSWPLLAAGIVAAAGSASIYAMRGIFAGGRRFQWYASSLALEGAARILPCALLAALGIASTVGFGFSFALGTGVAAAICLFGLRKQDSTGPPIDVAKMAKSTLLLAFASGLTYIIANIAPIVLASRLEDAALAASLTSAFVLARIPIFLFAPLQAFLIPALSHGAQTSDSKLLRRRIWVALSAAVFVGLPAAALLALLGPSAVQFFFNAPERLPHGSMAILGLSTLLMLIAQILQPALVALGRHRVATGSWLAGTVVFAVILFWPGDPVRAALASQMLGPLVVCLIMSISVFRCLRQMSKRSAETR